MGTITRNIILSAAAIALIALGVALYANAGAQHAVTPLLAMHGASDV